MSNPSSDSYRNPLRHTGQDYSFAPRYIRSRDPHSPTSASNDIKPKEQQGHYPTGSFWTNSTNGHIWVLQKITNNLANWILLSGTSGPMLMFLGGTGTTGTFPVTGDASGNVTLSSSDSSITITGGTNTLDFKTAGGPAVSIIQGDDGQNVIPTASTITFTGKTVLNGTNVVSAVVHPVFFKKNATSIEELDIQLAATSNNASKSITKAGLASFDSDQFNIDSATGWVSLKGTAAGATSFPTDDGNIAVPDGSGVLNVFGSGSATTTSVNNNNSVFVYAPLWSVVTTDTTLVKAHGYFANKSSLCVFTLPTTANVGDTFWISGMNANLWKIAQNTAPNTQTIHYGTKDTTPGTGGSLQATSQYDSIMLVCNVQNTDFIVQHSQGTITVT